MFNLPYFFIRHSLSHSIESNEYLSVGEHSHDTQQLLGVWCAVSFMISFFYLFYHLVITTSEKLPFFRINYFFIFLCINLFLLLSAVFYHHIVYWKTILQNKSLIRLFLASVFLNKDKLQELLQYIQFDSFSPKDKYIITHDYSNKQISLESARILENAFKEQFQKDNLDFLSNISKVEQDVQKIKFFNKK